MDVYKRFSVARQEAGGPSDPLFMLTDVKGLARVLPSEIALLKAEPCPNAHGTRVGSMSEWRTWSGKNVRITHVDGQPVHRNWTAAKCRSGVYRGKPPKRLHFLYTALPRYRVEKFYGFSPKGAEPIRLFGSKAAARLDMERRGTPGEEAVLFWVPVAERFLLADEEAFVDPSNAVLDRWMATRQARDCSDAHPRALPREEQTQCFRELVREGVVQRPRAPDDWKTSLRSVGSVVLKPGASIQSYDLSLQDRWTVLRDLHAGT